MADASIQATFVTLAFASAWEIGDIPHIYVKYAMQRTRRHEGADHASCTMLR